MELRNCPECGRLFTFIGRNLCPACIEQEEASFKEVEKYLEENPGAKVSEVSKATGVSEEKIVSFLRTGRLIPSGTQLFLECERCHQPISSGRFCSECRAVLSSSLRERSSVPLPQTEEAPLIRRREPDSHQKARMHTADRYRKTHR
ncbi:MAG: hypothetical protein QHH75_03605 [Bacillota bacterium]|nr:hypothetical protein [Bacillota bacterium]